MYKSLEPYAKLVNFLSAALGDNCEIALHDLTSKDQEIVAISNNPISGREVGAKLSNLSLHYLEEKQYLNHDFVMNYKTVGNDGKLMRAATYFIKEEGREMPVGMLCINVNISDLEYLTSTIKKILGIKEEKDIDSLFSGGATSALVNTFAGLDDFELLAFIVIQQKQLIEHSAQDEVS